MSARWATAAITVLWASSAVATSVPNPGFEAQSSCPTQISQLSLATPWISPTLASPDYMHSCSSGSAGVPSNLWGSQLPYEGEGYAAVITYNSQNDEREYLQAPLGAPLLPGATYQFSMWVSLAEDSGWAVDRIGAHFSNGAISLNDFWELPYVPQVENPASSYLTDETGWTQVSGSFVAAGGEDHVTIGNFRDDTQTQVVAHTGSSIGSIYYVDGIEFGPVPCPGSEVTFQNLEHVDALDTPVGPTYTNSGLRFWADFGNLETLGTLHVGYAGSTMINPQSGTVLTAANGTPSTPGDVFTVHWIDVAEIDASVPAGTPVGFRGTRLDASQEFDTLLLDGLPGPQRIQFANMTNLWKLEWNYPPLPAIYHQYDDVCVSSTDPLPALAGPGLALLALLFAVCAAFGLRSSPR